MKRLANIRELFPELCTAAQKIYDAWAQDENGEDEQYGAGGICDDVATAMSDVLTSAGIEAGTIHIFDDNHTVVMAAVAEGIFHIDIPFSYYERQHGYYHYTKIPDVTLEPHMVVCEKVDNDPSKLDTYLEE